jgi:nucleoside phosphorylase
MIAITFALAAESSGVIAKLREIGRDSDLVFGKIDNREVTIVRTGVGAKHCKERIEEVLHKARPRLVISSGFAGSAVENLAVGDLILAENFSDQRLLLTAKEILRDSRPQVVRLFTSTSIIGSIEQRSVIASKNGATAVDM